MALLHDLKDSPSAATAKSSRPPAGAREAVVLFINLAAMWTGLPMIYGSAVSPWALICTLIACTGLALGLRELPRPAKSTRDQAASSSWPAVTATPSLERPSLSLPLLLGVVPAALGAASAISWAAVPPSVVPGQLTTLLSILALWAYGGICLIRSAQRENPENQKTFSLAGQLPAARPGHRPYLLAALYGLGALALLTHPTLTESTAAQSQQGLAWSMLGAVVAGGLAAAIAGLYLGLALRRPRPRRGRFLAHALVIGTGVVTYAVLLRLSGN